MTFWILLTLAVVLSYISLKWRNILFSLGAMLGWISLWRYNLDYPPTNIVVGDITHTWLTYLFLIMAIAVMLIWFFNRQRSYTGYPKTAQEERDYQEELKKPRQSSSYEEETNEEYRTRVRKAVRGRRRR